MMVWECADHGEYDDGDCPECAAIEVSGLKRQIDELLQELAGVRKVADECDAAYALALADRDAARADLEQSERAGAVRDMRAAMMRAARERDEARRLLRRCEPYVRQAAVATPEPLRGLLAEVAQVLVGEKS